MLKMLDGKQSRSLVGELSTLLGLLSAGCAHITDSGCGPGCWTFQVHFLFISNWKLNYCRVWLYINIILHSTCFKIFVCRHLFYIDVFNGYFRSCISCSPSLPLNCVLAISKTWGVSIQKSLWFSFCTFLGSDQFTLPSHTVNTPSRPVSIPLSGAGPDPQGPSRPHSQAVSSPST